MAFQTGTRVDPRLGALDFSGFTNAANIRAQAMANLGQQIGGAITKYATNKKKKEEQGMRYETILPYTTDLFGTEQGIEMAKQFSLDPKVGSQIIEFVGMQQDQQAVNKAISANTDTEGKINWSGVLPAYIQLGGRDPSMVTGLTAEAKKADDQTFQPTLQELGEGKDKVTVVQTGKNQYQVVKMPGGEERIPTDIQITTATRELLKEARDFYKKGNTVEAQDILTSLGYIDKITGMPFTPKVFFPDVIPSEPSDNEAGGEDGVDSISPTEATGGTPSPAPTESIEDIIARNTDLTQ
tara:strand:+ start:90 stop:980 length:891 start_codon:yes stop_codon:yes gene_type:complete